MPAWLNDPTLYHNRGDSTWEGESVTFGDFVGLDDLMTEHPTVVNGFVDVYEDWIDLGIDGFRIDTAKHVNFEFWEQWSTEVLDYAHARRQARLLHVRRGLRRRPGEAQPLRAQHRHELGARLHVPVAGRELRRGQLGEEPAVPLRRRRLLHDARLVGHGAADLPRQPRHGSRRLLPAARMPRCSVTSSPTSCSSSTRGQPVVYYGDEQGFAGHRRRQERPAERSSRPRWPSTTNQPLVTGETFGSRRALRHRRAALPAHRRPRRAARRPPGARDGAQIERYVDNGAGVYAFSRVDRDEKIEYLVAANNATAAKTVDVPTLTTDARVRAALRRRAAVTADADGVASVPCRPSAVVLTADRRSTAPPSAGRRSPRRPPGGLTGSPPSPPTSPTTRWQETSFAWRVVGDDEWTPLGTAEDTTPRVFHDVGRPADGTLVEYRAVSTDAAARSGGITYASVGNADSSRRRSPTQPIELVTVPGSHNSEMGCAGDWPPGLRAAQLTLRSRTASTPARSTVPAGGYEYKVALNGSWDENYGAGGEPNGGNVAYTTRRPTRSRSTGTPTPRWSPRRPRVPW